MRICAFALAALALASGHAEAWKLTLLGAATGPPQKITIDARGPVVLVEITRAVALQLPPSAARGGEALLDLALPDGSVLVALDVRDGARWRPIDPAADGAHVADVYRSESGARGFEPISEPFDDDVTYRLRLLRNAGHAAEPIVVRYRFAIQPVAGNGRLLVRFPAAPERRPPEAEVKLALRDAADAEIAGVRTDLPAGATTATGHASTRAAWEVAWTPRPPRGRDAPPLDARVALAPLSSNETAVAFLARHPPGSAANPPGSVLFLVDRSRSVGLPGLSAERDLVRAMIEALPPSTRFDALFFDRHTTRLFPMSRPATREAIEAFETEMVPDRLQNGTALAAALGDAGALLRRETTTFGPRALLVLVTDGAIGEGANHGLLDRALGPTPGLDLQLAALTIRPVDDDPPDERVRDVLQRFVALRGGIARQLRASEIGDAVPAMLADLQQGGDLGGMAFAIDQMTRRIPGVIAPGAVLGAVGFKGRPPRSIRFQASARGKSFEVTPAVQRIAAEWLRPWAEEQGRRARFMSTPSLVALVEPYYQPADPQPVVRGSMDRMVVRNVLSLAYMPRARACYLNRTAATPALRDLTGKVRLAIDLVRGEVDRATIESSTLANPDIERCLTESAFEIEVPRATRSDAPVTAVLNMVFRPRTSNTKADIDLGAVGDQIDLVIEEMQRRETNAPAPRAP